MRLVDADKLKKDLKSATLSNGTLLNTNTVLALLDKYPTAYDVDKVVEQLELTSKTALDVAIKRIPGFRFMAPAFQTLIDECFEEAVRIVKAGGIDDKK